MPDIATPTQGIQAINLVVASLRKNESPKSYIDLSGTLELSDPTISQALSASRDVGLTKSGGQRGYYVLTPDGREYATYLSYNKTDEAKHILKKIIIQNIQWKFIMDFLSNNYNASIEPTDLVLHVESQLGKSWSGTMRNKIKNCYNSILKFADLIEIKEGLLVSKFGVGTNNLKAGFEVRQPEEVQTTSKDALEEYAKFETNDFKFSVKKDFEVLEFAQTQFIAWIEYLKKTLDKSR